jgi:hypothetical protein
MLQQQTAQLLPLPARGQIKSSSLFFLVKIYDIYS